MNQLKILFPISLLQYKKRHRLTNQYYKNLINQFKKHS